MKFFQHLSRVTLGLLLTLGALWSSSYAVELDSTNITSAPFNCSIWNTSCDLSSKNITSIASGTFVNHTNLTTLYLSSNQITSIESGDFSGISSLTTLDLEFNQITSIESGDFSGISNLQTLNLVRNQITSIESWDFAGLSSLTTLNLGSMQITSIESGDFAGLSSLTTLNLGGNQITSIESWDFAGLSSLTTLYLGSMQITSIESGDFAGLSSLSELYIYWNSITSIESGDFSGLDSLTTLELNSNCLNTDDNLVTDYLNTLNGAEYWNQLVCIQTQYSPSMSTSWSVTGSLSFVWPASSVSSLLFDNPNMTLYDHVFTENGSYLFDYSSLIDNGQSVLWYDYLWSKFMTNNIWIPRPDTVLWSVTWIDRDSPIWTLNYSTTGITNQSVTVTLTINESGSVTNNSWSTSYIFSGNGDFIFEYQDSVGNTGTTTASVTWIDTTAPTITLNGSGTLSGYVGTSYTDAGASWTDAVAGSGTLIGSWSVNTSLTGTYIISYSVTDTAGNTSTATRTVIILPIVVPPVVIIPPVVPRSSWGGGWGGSLPSKDNCPAWDYSPSYYDGSCGTKTTTSTTNTGTIIKQPNKDTTTPPIKKPIDTNPTKDDTDSIVSNVISNTPLIQKKAYERSSSVGITTADTVQEARLDKNITRAELAKMLSVYATDVLKKTASDTACEFEDADQVNKWLVSYIRQACQLGIMGVQSDGKTSLTSFRPNSFVTRAEFGTALSRILYGTTYNNDSTNTEWRAWHLDNLYKNNLINITAPTLQEQRGWVMTMLYRTVQ